MKRFGLVLGATCLLLAAAVWSNTAQPLSSSGDLQVQVEGVNPWNNLKVNNSPSTFRFAIVTDRTGGPRDGIFERAVAQLNILQPEFVVSVGDLISGGTEELGKIKNQWDQFNGFISKLQMPFFYVPGNHDISNTVMEGKWREQFGRTYYHFVYKNTLFMLLNTENLPGKTVKFGTPQIDWAKKVLNDNDKVDWTLVFFHKPIWADKDVAQTGWLDIEKALAGRKYTVFAGHRHIYKKFKRQGQNYYQLATTGGSSKLRGMPFGEFDHLVWVTMKRDGPVLANLMMDGIYNEDLSEPTLTTPTGTTSTPAGTP